MDDLERYLEEIVGPTIAEFELEPMSIRRCFLACVVTAHAVEYLAYPKKADDLKKKFRTESAAFNLVADIANAFKHVVATRDGKRVQANQAFSRPSGALGSLAIGVSRIGDLHGGVELKSHQGIDLLETVRDTVTFLRRKAAERIRA